MAWVGQDPDQAIEMDLVSGFLEALSDGGVGQALPEVHPASGDGIVAVVGSSDEEDLVPVIDDHVGRRNDAARGRCRRVLKVVDSSAHTAGTSQADQA